jgi:hypothetical protein
MLSAMFTNLLAVADKQRRGKSIVIHSPNCAQRVAVRVAVPTQIEKMKHYFRLQVRR